MLVVLPYHEADKPLALNLLRWLVKMDDEAPEHQCLVVTPCEDATDVGELAGRYFDSVSLLQYQEGRWTGWPLGPNRAFRTAAVHIQTKFTIPWLWLEPDCVPLRSRWLDALQTGYDAMRKPFAGYIVEPEQNQHHVRYMAGCGIYPHNVHRYSVNAFLCEKTPFDMAMGPQIMHHVGPLNGLVHHEVTSSPQPFLSDDDVDARIAPGVALYHKCKDGSLLKILNRQVDSKSRRYAWKKKKSSSPK